MLRKQNFLFLIVLILFVSSCDTNNTKYIEKQTTTKSISLILDTNIISIDVSEKQLSSYKVFSVNDEGLYCGYNHKLNCLDLFSIAEARYIKSIPLKSTDEIRSISMVDDNLFFILTKKLILSIDSLGKSSDQIFINGRKDFFSSNYFMEIDYGRNFTYNKNDKKLYVTTYNPQISSTSEQYELPFVAVVDPKSPNLMTQIPVSYSKLYLKHNYGFMTSPQYYLSHDGSRIFHNFCIEPNIYIYDIKTQKTMIYGGKPNTKDVENHTIASHLNDEEANNTDKAYSHLVTNIFYFPVVSTKDNDFIFRGYHVPSKRTENAKYNDINTNNRYLTVFDKNLNMITNLSLNDRKYNMYGQFVINDRIYLPCNNKLKRLTFKSFKFKVGK